MKLLFRYVDETKMAVFFRVEGCLADLAADMNVWLGVIDQPISNRRQVNALLLLSIP